MAREDRPLPPPVAENEPLLAEGHRYAFFQALRLLRLHLGEETFAQSVRVRPTLSLSFPDHDINRNVRENDILRLPRSADRRVGNECVSHGRPVWAPSN